MTRARLARYCALLTPQTLPTRGGDLTANSIASSPRLAGPALLRSGAALVSTQMTVFPNMSLSGHDVDAEPISIHGQSQ
jgi:hypothetical protein